MNKSLELLKISPFVVTVHSYPEAEAAVAHGCEALEVDVSAGVEILHKIVAAYQKEILIGASGVLSSERAFEAVDEGAQFISTPTFDLAIYKTCDSLDVPVLAEALTPSELRQAAALGSQMVKLFPACAVSEDYLAALLELSLCDLAVAGAAPEEVSALRTAGAACVFVPSKKFLPSEKH